MPDKVDEFVARVEELLTPIWAETQAIHGVNLTAYAALIHPTVQAVEEVSSEFGGMSGPEKRDGAIKVLNKFVDIPLVPEWLEDNVIGFAIDALVASWNKIRGKLWPREILPAKE